MNFHARYPSRWNHLESNIYLCRDKASKARDVAKPIEQNAEQCFTKKNFVNEKKTKGLFRLFHLTNQPTLQLQPKSKLGKNLGSQLEATFRQR